MVHDQESSARFDLDRQDFGGQTARVPVPADRRRASHRSSHPPDLRRTPGALCTDRIRPPGPDPPREFTPPANATPERIAQLKKNFEDTQAELEKIPFNGVRIGIVDVGGPYSQVSGPRPRAARGIYTCGHLDGRHQPACVRQIMTRPGAARVPAAGDGARRSTSTWPRRRKRRSRSSRSRKGWPSASQALLVSPDFLFRIERDRPAQGRVATSHRITQHELASRLSYFIWASMPDASCDARPIPARCAIPWCSTSQVRRMLRDPEVARARRALRRPVAAVPRAGIGHARPDRFPDFEDYLRLLDAQGDRAVRRARHPRRPEHPRLHRRPLFVHQRAAGAVTTAFRTVTGPEFRRVDLTGTPRSGVLTQASVLTVSSYATRTSPVLRGKWILENLLDRAAARAAGRRAESRRNATSARRRRCGCSSRRTGRIRSAPRATGGWIRSASASRTSTPSAPGGRWTASSRSMRRAALPDGRKFNGPEELSTILEGRPRGLRACLTTKLLTYALGRGLERYDTKTVKRIAEQPAGEGLPVLGPGARDRQEPSVSVAATGSEWISTQMHRTRERSSEPAMIVTRRSTCHRRTFLKGMGAAVALPMLDAMTPALRPSAAPRAGAAPARLHLRPERHHHGRLDAERRRARRSSSRAS